MLKASSSSWKRRAETPKNQAFSRRFVEPSGCCRALRSAESADLVEQSARVLHRRILGEGLLQHELRASTVPLCNSDTTKMKVRERLVFGRRPFVRASLLHQR